MPSAHRFLLIALPIAGAALAASETAPIALSGGLARLGSASARDLVDEHGGNNLDGYGYTVCLGLSAPEPTPLGYPWLDLVFTRHRGDGSRIDTVGALYVSRYWFAHLFSIGAGLGGFYDDLAIERDGASERARAWRIGGKAVVGVGGPQGVFAELGYQYSGAVDDVPTSGASLVVGVRF